MRTKIVPLCLCIALFLSTALFLNVKAASAINTLNLSLATDQSVYKLWYTPASIVNVAGNLTYNGAPVSNGLVSLTVVQGTFQNMIRPILFRTLTTGSTPNQNWPISNITIQPVKYSGGYYVPWTTFDRPSTQSDPGPLFNITFTNVAMQTNVYLALSVVDSAQEVITSRVVPFETQSIPINSTVTYMTDSMYLGSWVALGNATVYVSFFDNFPPYLYFPLRPESSAQFQIIQAGAASFSTQTTASMPSNAGTLTISGNYQMTFAINYKYDSGTIYSPWGNYSIRVTSSYQGLGAVNMRTIWLKIPGDLNGSAKVDISDAALIGRYWQQTVPPADPRADANNSGKVDVSDAAIVGAFWGKYEQH